MESASVVGKSARNNALLQPDFPKLVNSRIRSATTTRSNHRQEKSKKMTRRLIEEIAARRLLTTE
jgi:hypothetical protein